MPEAKYYKDYNHNYMILESKNDEEGDSYQRRMLVSNKIEGILGCSLRDVNGAVYFYYDISSKVSFENLYKGKQLSYEQVKDFFIQLNMIYQNLGKFFMDERALLVRPDCIYYDLTSRKYFGLYYPMNKSKIQSPYEELMDFLLAHIDSGNQNLVDCMYRIYEMSETQNFLLTDALCVFEELESDTLDVEDIIEESSILEGNVVADVNIIDSEGISMSKPMNSNNENYSEGYNGEDEYLFLSEEVKKNKKVTDKRERVKSKKTDGIHSKSKNSRKYYAIFTFISLCGICGTAWIYFNYKLTQQELMMIVCCMALMGVCFVFSFIQYFLSGKKAEQAEKEELELQQDIYDEFRDEKPVVLQDVLDKNINSNMNMNINNSDFRQVEIKERYGETVFMDLRKQKMEYKLYALDKKNKKHIELTQFPFTIGKMAGCVDCVLTDDSISRLHARIEKQDEKVFLTDMNSTNGTYKNGLRMEPSETVELEPGDEIRFGKLNYCYR
ncbi:MAG: FHA domain-containing protein [Lachnospiraceae bacterium]|nr:FHA domain-containing protein [Lachnospiraceae bacterium]